MSISPIMNGTSATSDTGATASQTAAAASATGTDALANEQTFLKLFVAQLQNQDPLNPQDGQQFVAQLAQFSQLEQSIQMRTDLDGILSDIQTSSSTTGTTGTTQGTPAS